LINSDDLSFLKDALPFWNDITAEQQNLLTEAVSLREFRAGSAIHSGSEDCSGLFIVRSGQVRAYIFSQSGKEVTLYRLFERDICIFSASCMMRDIRFDIFVEAEKDTKAILIPTFIYQNLVNSSVAVSNYSNKLMSSRFSDVMWTMEQILFMSFDERLAIFLLEQSDIEGNDAIPMTHETIAKNMGTAREVVTRMLKYFSAEGMVELSRGGVTITNRKKLEKQIDKNA
jgi:CRP/FNR family transcriptional regulator